MIMNNKLICLALTGIITTCLIIFNPSHNLAQNIHFQDSNEISSTLILSQNSSEKESPSLESNQSSSSQETERTVKPENVMFQGKKLFTIEKNLGDISPKTRAKDTSERIEQIAEDYRISLDDFRVVNLDNLKLIEAQDKIIIPLGQIDAATANKSLDELADEYQTIIRNEIKKYRESMTQEEILKSAVYAIISTLGFLIALVVINQKLPIIFARISNWQQHQFRSIRYQSLQFLSGSQVSHILQTLFKLIRYTLLFLLFYFYLPFLLICFPFSRSIGRRLQGYFWQAIKLVFGGLVNYLPNLFIIAIIVIVAYYINRFSRFIFQGIKRGRIRINRFYPEWADPTYNITLFLIVGLAAVLIFPYLPASDSPGFQGVSLFAGALFTLGSTAIIGNIISGIVLIYTRSFQVGDIIKANGISGKVIEKSMLSTRLMNFENEIITIPNGSLIGSEITNYSAVIRDSEQPLILKTTITLGYDVPWRKVHQVMIEAAKASEGVLQEPTPFVFQSSLDDFYVSYVLKVYTDQPEKMNAIYSQLHQNLQDKCNEADIEILSPHYSAIRDGNLITIPANYLDKNYQAPSFRIETSSKSSSGK